MFYIVLIMKSLIWLTTYSVDFKPIWNGIKIHCLWVGEWI